MHHQENPDSWKQNNKAREVERDPSRVIYDSKKMSAAFMTLRQYLVLVLFPFPALHLGECPRRQCLFLLLT